MPFKRVASVVLTLAAIGWLVWSLLPPVQPPADQICDDWSKGCTFQWQGETARLVFLEKPVPLRPFRVHVLGVPERKLSMAFAMYGMTMGPLSFPLSYQGGARWQGKAVLTVCTQGRSDWLITLTGSGHRATLRVNLPGKAD